MTVYVEDLRLAARVGRLNARWSHLFSDTSDAELHIFAEQIGLRRSWFQHPNDPVQLRRHYDVTDSKRQQAIAAGATPITWREAGKMLRAAAATRGEEERE